MELNNIMKKYLPILETVIPAKAGIQNGGSWIKSGMTIWKSGITKVFSHGHVAQSSAACDQKTALSEGVFADSSGSEFPGVTEQASFISEVSGRVPSDSSRSKTHTPASTFTGDRLSTNIMSPSDSSATLLPGYQSINVSANLSSYDIKRGSFRSLFNMGSISP